MKKSTVKGFILGVVCTLLVIAMAGTAFATSGSKTATLVYNNIKITLNGQAVTPKDANGNVVEPFIIDGTTYLPVRAVADAMGLSVAWDGVTKTAVLSAASYAEQDVKKELSEIRNWLVGEIWNAGICDMSHYYENGKSSTGDTMDAEFSLRQLAKAIAKKDGYDAYMNNLPENYSEISNVWSKVSAQVDLLYAEILLRGTAVSGSKLDTGLYNQYFTIFDDLFFEYYN